MYLFNLLILISNACVTTKGTLPKSPYLYKFHETIKALFIQCVNNIWSWLVLAQMNWIKQYHNELYGSVCLVQTFPNLHHENFSPCVG